MIYSLKVFIVFVVLGLPFPQVHLSVGGGGGGQQASSLSSTHKLWNFHRYSLVLYNRPRCVSCAIWENRVLKNWPWLIKLYEHSKYNLANKGQFQNLYFRQIIPITSS